MTQHQYVITTSLPAAGQPLIGRVALVKVTAVDGSFEFASQTRVWGWTAEGARSHAERIGQAIARRHKREQDSVRVTPFLA